MKFIGNLPHSIDRETLTNTENYGQNHSIAKNTTTQQSDNYQTASSVSNNIPSTTFQNSASQPGNDVREGEKRKVDFFQQGKTEDTSQSVLTELLPMNGTYTQPHYMQHSHHELLIVQFDELHKV